MNLGNRYLGIACIILVNLLKAEIMWRKITKSELAEAIQDWVFIAKCTLVKPLGELMGLIQNIVKMEWFIMLSWNLPHSESSNWSYKPEALWCQTDMTVAYLCQSRRRSATCLQLAPLPASMKLIPKMTLEIAAFFFLSHSSWALLAKCSQILV